MSSASSASASWSRIDWPDVEEPFLSLLLLLQKPMLSGCGAFDIFWEERSKAG